MTLYTKFGDEGNTNTMSGEVCRKNDTVIEINGLIDELIVAVEAARIKYFYTEKETESNEAVDQDKKTLKQLNKIIEALYIFGAEVSDGKTTNITKTIDKGFVDKLEEKINDIYKPQKGFMYFTKTQAVLIGECRVRTRRLERGLTPMLRQKRLRPVTYQYFNRLSDYFFALQCHEENREDKDNE